MFCFSLLSGKNGAGRYCFLVVTFKKEIRKAVPLQADYYQIVINLKI